MGVTYKLKDEVVHFIISQRQGNPFSSCRQLAESVTQKFGLQLSKSSVHDVLKESGIVTPRGRKPKDKFKIPQEKKKQIQAKLSQTKLLPEPTAEVNLIADVADLPSGVIARSASQRSEATKQSFKEIASSATPPRNDTLLKNAPSNDTIEVPLKKEDSEISATYEGAGKIFYKAALWDLGIFSEGDIKEADWDYYLTYSKGIKVDLEDNRDFFIDLSLPIERCIRETADGLINNIKPFIVDKVSDEGLFKSCMEAEAGYKMYNISIVGQNDHVIIIFDDIMEYKRTFLFNNRIFVENEKRNVIERSKAIFFPQLSENNDVMNNIFKLKGFDATTKDDNIVTLLIDSAYDNKTLLQEAAKKLNGMYMRDDQGRLVTVKIQE